jgi:uncharacterized membrane protein YeaQ/YmgE (transglycosylase-associated protein family)
MELIVLILVLAVTGLFVGALGRLALPGPDPMSLTQTMLVGVGATVIVGVLAKLLFDSDGASILLSVLVAMGIVWLIRRSRERAAGPPATADGGRGL